MKHQMIDLYIYLSKATDILYDYQWVYNFRATHLLVSDILTHIPKDWTKALLDLSDNDLSLLTSGIVKDGWPTCLSDFVHRCHELILPHAAMGGITQSKGWECIPAELQKGMSPKKQHEVLHLTSFIYHQCLESNLSRILDLGSGLGYLGKLLHHRSGYRVLGLEANAGCVGRAVSMQQPICSSGVKHVALTLRPAHKEEEWRTTVGQVRSVLENRGNWEGRCSCGIEAWGAPDGVELGGTDEGASEGEADPSVCMVSLHSCGDLSPTALRLFLELPQARRLVVMACCFHKMKSAQAGGYRRRGKGSEGEVDSSGERFRDGSLEDSETHLLEGRPPSIVGGGCTAATTRSPSRGRSHEAEGGRVGEVAASYPCEDADEELFPDFPMSSELERLVCARRSFLRRPLLRLASEMTVEMWRLMTEDQRHEHSVHVLGRAVFELYAKRERYKLKKMRRRGVRKTQRSNFVDYFEDALQRFEFIPLGPPTVTSSTVDGANGVGPCLAGSDRLLPAEPRERPPVVQGPATSSPPCPGSVGGDLCAPSSDIPYIDEDDGDAMSRTARPPGECAAGSDAGAPFPRESDTGPVPFRQDAAGSPRPDGMEPADVNDCRDAIPLEVHRLKLKALTEEQCTPEILRLTTALYALQAAIQSIAEGLVIADRLAFLLEHGGPSVEASLVRVFDRSLSPRSLAIVALKGNPMTDVINK